MENINTGSYDHVTGGRQTEIAKRLGIEGRASFALCSDLSVRQSSDQALHEVAPWLGESALQWNSSLLAQSGPCHSD